MPRRCYPFVETEAGGQKVSHALAKRCQQMFQDQFIYQNPWFQELVEDDSKGYVPIKHILNDEAIKAILQLSSSDQVQRIELIRSAIQEESKVLKANTIAIRRYTPFEDCTDSIKFFYIDGFEEGTTKFELLQMLNLKDEVKKIQIKKKHLPYARVYYADQRQVQGKKQQWKQLHGLDTETYSIHTANLALFDNVRTQELNPSTEKMIESFWNEKTQNKMESEEESNDELEEFSDEERMLGDPRHGKLNKEDIEKIEQKASGRYQLESKSFDNNCLF